MGNACSSAIAVGIVVLGVSGAACAEGPLSGDGTKVGTRVEIKDIKRDDGGTVTLRFQFINDSDKEVIDNGSYTAYPTFPDGNGTVGGVTLIDSANKKKYLVVRDAQKHCICAEGIKSLKKGERANAWAKFPAPPDSVQKITVVVPGFEPVESVPITSR